MTQSLPCRIRASEAGLQQRIRRVRLCATTEASNFVSGHTKVVPIALLVVAVVNRYMCMSLSTAVARDRVRSLLNLAALWVLWRAALSIEFLILPFYLMEWP